jgi:hypothetical protein
MVSGSVDSKGLAGTHLGSVDSRRLIGAFTDSIGLEVVHNQRLNKNEEYAEVLILEELGRAKCRDGWTGAGTVAHKYSERYARISGGRTDGE